MSGFSTRRIITLISSNAGTALLVAAAALLAGHTSCAPRAGAVDVPRLLGEMADFEVLAARPDPFFETASASTYSRESRKGGEAWFDNRDVGQYVRTETTNGRTEQVLADLAGPGAVARFWSANPTRKNVARFYFDGETAPRLELPLENLFLGRAPFGPEFSYVSGTGGNLYFPLPYAKSLKITVEESTPPLRLYYEIAYRTYEPGTRVVGFDPRSAASWEEARRRAASALTHPQPAASPKGAVRLKEALTIRPGETAAFPGIEGEKAVYAFSARVLDTRESDDWKDPARAHNALRSLILSVDFDGERSIDIPLGDFFGSAPGVNPYENLFFTVEDTGRMTSRLLMPFKSSMTLSLANAGSVPYTVEIELLVGPRRFPDRGWHLRAQWGSLTRESWPPFDLTVLDTSGEGKVIGTVYEVANPSLIWWGEGDQKIFVDGEAFPSTFGTGTEDDYGYAYGDNRPFTRPYHAQTRVDGPASGGHISLNRWYVLDALPFRTAMRFDQEIWHWMPCTCAWNNVIYWYAPPGAPGPRPANRAALAPVDLGIRSRQLDPIEGEALAHEETSGTAGKERLANCSGAEHLVWRGARKGGRMKVRFEVPEDGRYAIELNLCMSPDYGRHKLSIDGRTAAGDVDGYSPRLYWQRPKLGVFDLKRGAHVLTVEALDPNPAARPGNVFGLDFIFIVRQPD